MPRKVYAQPRCLICHGSLPRNGICRLCRRASRRNNERPYVHREPHPLLSERLETYEARAAMKVPLF